MLPARFEYLGAEPGPRMLVEALKLYGTKEQTGTADNPEILAWAKEVGLSKAYSTDSVPWCGLYLAVVAKRAGKEVPKNPLWALNWKNFGIKADRPMLGDVLVVERNGGGHVAIYVGEDDTAYWGLGGNQSDMVCIAPILKSRRPVFRRPKYINTPVNVRPIFVSAGGPRPSATKED